MKHKYLLIPFFLFFAFLSSFVPYEQKSLGINKEAPLKTLIESQKDLFKDTSKKFLLNFWDPKDPESRIRNINYSRYLNEDSIDNLILVSICVSDDRNLAEQILKIDNISGDNTICLLRNDVNENIFKEYQVETGNRSFLIDESGVLKRIMPSENDLNNI